MYSRGIGKGWRVEFLEEGRQVVAGEGPFERLADSREVALEVAEAVGELRGAGEVVGRQDLALHDREVDLDLVEPSGMARGMDELQPGVPCLRPLDGSRSAVRGAVVDNPRTRAGRVGTGRWS